MVLYHDDGRVVIEHERYLETEAKRDAGDRRRRYTDQIDVYKQTQRQASTQDVQIIVDPQNFRTLYSGRFDGWGSDFQWIKGFKQKEERTIETPLCRETLILCSSTARDYFLYNPGKNELHLPITYPRVHEKAQSDDQMAYIRADEIEKYILPWVDKVKAHMNDQEHRNNSGDGKPAAFNKVQNKEMRENLTRPGGAMAIEIPNDLLEKIHLYNAMLQLGLPKFVQLPLIDALVSQMSETKLSECHLDTLEITIGRFYSRGVAILDPIVNHFIGTYAHRPLDDRNNPDPRGPRKRKRKPERNPSEERMGGLFRADGTPETRFERDVSLSVKFRYTKRKYLDFAEQKVRRGKLGKDTYVLPPELPVLGHCIKHWSGVRIDGSVAPKRTEFPLNVGLQRKFIRRDVAKPADVEDCEEVLTIRLNRFSAPGTE
ncbi:uncharacterized protein yc1106_05758 [Curvularia clavata]|uniref:Uncharacterized protein n=1 Tax=Curvularia clavata TaxID=95742 RepID=A0A9Q8ZBL9_CURCL|nr:uncharacterized protein yc1106_05758 [Curvularia clavata]